MRTQRLACAALSAVSLWACAGDDALQPPVVAGPTQCHTQAIETGILDRSSDANDGATPEDAAAKYLPKDARVARVAATDRAVRLRATSKSGSTQFVDVALWDHGWVVQSTERCIPRVVADARLVS